MLNFQYYLYRKIFTNYFIYPSNHQIRTTSDFLIHKDEFICAMNISSNFNALKLKNIHSSSKKEKKLFK